MSESMPVAVRATEATRQRRTLIPGRTTWRSYTAFDVRSAEGTVQHDVDLDAVLKGASYPADSWSALRGAERAADQWADSPYGRPLPE